MRILSRHLGLSQGPNQVTAGSMEMAMWLVAFHIKEPSLVLPLK